ncbi:MAG: DUF4153 domain-containing protein [Kiritimatiellae bacterium]|nr:DUF4153 domain-containing protein [Kiritimatiellia bacterium]
MNGKNGAAKHWMEQIAMAAARFPVAMLLTLFNTFFVWWAVDDGPESRWLVLAASGMAIPLSIASRLIVEKITWKRGFAHFLQALSFALFIALAAWFDGMSPREHFAWTYMLSLAAVWAFAAWAKGFRGESGTVVSSLAFGGFIGGIAALGVGCGTSLILVALNVLFDAGFGNAFAVAWGSAVFTVGLGFAIAYAPKNEPFACPKAWKALVGFLAFPIFLVFLAVLLVYALKCAVTVSLPDGEVNWLVGSATALWLIIHPLVAVFKGRIYTGFRRVGPWCMAPLIVLQAVAVAIRINAYGLTPARYASVLLVVFAAIHILATAIRPSFADGPGFLLFSAMALFAGLSPWNVVDFGVDGQVKRLESFAERRRNGEEFDEAERWAIMDSWDFVHGYDRVGNHWETRVVKNPGKEQAALMAEFEKEWGFKYLERPFGPSSRRIDAPCHWVMLCRGPEKPIWISGFSRMEKVSFASDGGRVFAKTRRAGGPGIDITDAVKARMKEVDDSQDFVADTPDGCRVVAESIDICVTGGGDDAEIASASGDGWLLLR